MKAYGDGLRMLAGRELSEAQVRQRLTRRAHPPEDIDNAIARLRENGAIDDARTAAAIGRREMAKKRGRLRVRRAIEAAGIAGAVARKVTDALFADTDADALLEAALARRLRQRTVIKDGAEFRRLYRALVAQGFEPDAVLRLLEARRR